MRLLVLQGVCLAAVMAFVASPAHAQLNSSMMNPDKPSKTQEEIEREKQLEKQYKDSLREIPDVKGSDDPWHNVRSTEDKPPPAAAAPKVAQHKPKPKPKTPAGATASAAPSPWPGQRSPPPWPGGQPAQAPWPTPH